MKSHVVIKLDHPIGDARHFVPWTAFIHDKTRQRTTLRPDVDRVFALSGAKTWVTSEYWAMASEWSAHERQAAMDRTFRVILRNDVPSIDGIVRQLRRIPGVEEAHGVRVGAAALPTIGPARPDGGRSRPGDQIHLPYARALTRGSAAVKIAVLDTGVSKHHPELRGKVRDAADFVNLDGLDTAGFIGDCLGYDDDPEDEYVGHGTHVSGIIAARGIAMDEGVAPDCTLMVVRVLAALRNGDRVVGAGIIDNINVGIKWAVDHGADVINMSLGVRHEGGGLPHKDVVHYALSKGATLVAASGNDGTAERYYPGALDGVIAVGAIDADGLVTGFTSFGANIFVVAPGVDIYSAHTGARYAFASGTSQASPYVAGAVALLKSCALEQGRRLSNSDITQILRATSDRVTRRLRDQRAGFGVINLADAFQYLLRHLPPL